MLSRGPRPPLNRLPALSLLLLTACQTGLPRAPRPDSVEPPSGAANTATPVTIRGSDFYPDLWVSFRDRDRSRLEETFHARLGEVELTEVRLIDDATLVATVPAGLVPGAYDLEIIDPAGRSGGLGEAFTVFVPVLCGPGACGGRGACDESSGFPVCDCDEGFAGIACGECAPGYHLIASDGGCESGIRILDIELDQRAYKNGDRIQITLWLSAEPDTIAADWRIVDSEFEKPAPAWTGDFATGFRSAYDITPGNQRADGVLAMPVHVSRGEGEWNDVAILSLDNTPPAVAITGPNGGQAFVTTDGAQLLTGTCDDDVVTLTANTGIVSAACAASGTFAVDLFLSDGVNTLEVYADDAVGNRATAMQMATFDTTPVLPMACAPMPPAEGPVIDVKPDDVEDLPAIVASAVSGTTIELAAGTYTLNGGDAAHQLRFDTPGVTLRSETGDAADVILDAGYGTDHLIVINASRVLIAEVTITHTAGDAIVVTCEGGDNASTSLYRVDLVDSAADGVTISPGDGCWADDGVVACSSFVLTDAGRAVIGGDCELGGTNLRGVRGHAARGWQVRDNRFEDIWCGNASHALGIDFSRRSRDTIIEGNRLFDCAIGMRIGFGPDASPEARMYADDPCPASPLADHIAGIVRNNFIFATDTPQPNFDSGIAAWYACGTEIVHNSVVSVSPPYSSIEYRYAETSVAVRNNLLSHNLRQRTSAVALLEGNVTYAAPGLFVGPTTGDLHLESDAVVAIDQGVVLAPGLCSADIDGEPRDGAPDVGADEASP